MKIKILLIAMITIEMLFSRGYAVTTKDWLKAAEDTEMTYLVKLQDFDTTTGNIIYWANKDQKLFSKDSVTGKWIVYTIFQMKGNCPSLQSEVLDTTVFYHRVHSTKYSRHKVDYEIPVPEETVTDGLIISCAIAMRKAIDTNADFVKFIIPMP